MNRIFAFLAASIVFGIVTAAVAQPLAVSSAAPDFPPGKFTDGNTYRLSDLKGKVVVLTFFDPIAGADSPFVQKQKALIKAFEQKPVKFFGVAVQTRHNSVADFARRSGLTMPLFADVFGVMDQQYGVRATILNPWTNIIVDANGKIAEGPADLETIEKLIESSKATAKFTSLDIGPSSLPLADLFESGQFAAGVKQLSAARNAPKADLKALNLLQATLKTEAAAWRTEAEAIAVMDPLRSYDLCARISFLYPGSELGKSVQDPLRRLAAEPTVKAELNARIAYQKVAQIMSQAPSADILHKGPLGAAFAEVAKKHPDTPTGAKAKTLAETLGYKAPTPKKK